ncbi:MAG: DUF2341 domain-containing protein [Bacteroidales bacterium]|jgi:hypothetical protein|nr:DUF2341 domain-containing protein [Bacteroidales bacterium]
MRGGFVIEMVMETRNNSFGMALKVLAVIMTGLLSVQFLSAQADWYNENWSYRREVAVPNVGGADLTEFQVKITLDNSFDFSKALADGSDIRVAAGDGTTLIPFWIEEWIPASTAATIWVRVPSIPVSDTVVYIYYGNPTPAAPGEPVETPPVGPFTRAAGNPIVPAGATGSSLLAENIVYDPISGHYWMCLANYSQSCISLCWSDTPTDPGSWTWGGNVITTFSIFYSGAPHLLHHNGTWYLFYADRPNIRVATSSAVGGPYTINPTPALVPSGPAPAWDNFRVDEPYVFQRNDGKWIMIYMGDAGDVTEQVGYAIADNVGGPYTAYEGNPVIRFGPSGSYDAGTVADPWVYEYHGTYYVGYTVSSTKSSPWQTALATTTDWVNFTKIGVILPASGTAFDAANSFRGAVTRIGDTYVFSYTGGGYGMGIATQPVYSAPAPGGVVNTPDAVFDFYDGFDGTSLDMTKWSLTNGSLSNVSVNGGFATISVSSSYTRISGTSSFGMNTIGETRAAHLAPRTLNVIGEVGFASSDWSTVRIVDNFTLGTTYWQRQAKIAPNSDVAHPFANMVQTADANWHVFSVFRQSPNIAGFQIDDNSVETTTSNVPTSDLPPFLMAYTESVVSRLDVDWTRVRKWAGADPVTVVGSEEVGSGLAEANYWTGDHPVDGTAWWSEPLNWSENSVPDINTDVIIPDRTNDPVLGDDAFCRNLTINSGATLTLNGFHVLTVSGDWTADGSLSTAGSGKVIFNGSEQTISGTSGQLFYHLTISSPGSVTLGVNVQLQGDLTVTSGVFDIGAYSVNRTSPGGFLILQNGSSLRIGGTGALPAGYANYSFTPGSRVEYSGANQSITDTFYPNLILSGSGIKTFPAGGLDGNGNLIITGTARALLPNGSESDMGSLVLGTSAALSGSYGSTSSAAANTDDNHFAVGYTGIINHTVLSAGNWLGGTSADWNNSANWVGGIPGASTDVVIPAYAEHQPVVNPDSPNATCRNLTINPGASLTIKPGQAMTVSGDLSNSGTLTIESASVLSSGSLIVLSGSSTGNVIYDRQVNTSNNLYHFFSSPVDAPTFPTTATVYSYDEPAGAWITTTTNAKGRGYSLQKGITSLRFEGTIVTADVTVEASSPYADAIIGGVAGEYDNRTPAPGRDFEDNWGGGGWNLLGNPYTSALDVGSFITVNSTQFDPNYKALYLYDGSDYRYVSNPVGSWLSGTAMNENFIQAGQGFFVLAMNDASEFTFNRTMQGHDTDVLLLKSASAGESWPGLQLNLRSGDKVSSTLVVYNDNMSTGLDPGYDIGLMSSGSGVDIYTTLALADNGVNFTRQALPVTGADNLKVAVGIDSEKGGEVTFSAVTVPIGTNRFWLEDRVTGTFTDLTTKSYTVNLPANTYGTGRFLIISSANTPTSAKPGEFADPGVRIWMSDGKLIIKGEFGERSLYELYDLNGKTIMDGRLEGNELNIINLPGNLHGVYVVRVIDGLKVTTRKIAVL